MQKFNNTHPSTVGETLAPIIENDQTTATLSSGASFPGSSNYIGDHSYRTDQDMLYVATTVSPDTWTPLTFTSRTDFPSDFGTTTEDDLVHRTDEQRFYKLSKEPGIRKTNAAPGDSTGSHLSLSSNTLVSITSSNEVTVYLRTADDWAIQQVIQCSYPTTVAVDGDTLAISGYSTLLSTRTVSVYTRTGTYWTLEQEIEAPGYKLAIDGDTLVVGYPSSPQNWYDSFPKVYSYVQVYTRTGTVWTLMQTIQPAGQEIQDKFGFSIDINGDAMVIGAPYHGYISYFTKYWGKAFIYNLVGGVWTLTRTIEDSQNNEKVGYSVSIGRPAGNLSNDIYVALGTSSTGYRTVYVEHRKLGVWQTKKTIVEGSDYEYGYFGRNVKLDPTSPSGMALAVSNPEGEYQSPENSGLVSIYKLESDEWVWRSTIKPTVSKAGAKFGSTLELEYPYVVTSAPSENTAEGAIYVFKEVTLNDFQPTLYTSDVWRELLPTPYYGAEFLVNTYPKYVGMLCFRTDEEKAYVLKSAAPDVWEEVFPNKFVDYNAPTTDLYIGMLWYNTPEYTHYQLKSIGPDVWEPWLEVPAAGAVFPTTLNFVGRIFYRTDLQESFQLKSTDPDVWGGFTSNPTLSDAVANWTIPLGTTDHFDLVSDGTSKTLGFTGIAPGITGSILINKIDTSVISMGPTGYISAAGLEMLQSVGSYILTYACFGTHAYCEVEAL